MKAFICCICVIAAGCVDSIGRCKYYSVSIEGKSGFLTGRQGERLEVYVNDENGLIVGSTNEMASAIDESGVRKLTIPKRADNCDIEGVGRFGLAFSEKLEEVAIADGVRLAVAAFYYDVNLKTVNLPADLSEIPASLFSNCVELRDVQIPHSVRTIGDSAFYGTRIQRINVPDSVTHIGHCAFGKCRELLFVSLPGNVFVEDDTFDGCDEAKLMVVRRENGRLQVRPGCHSRLPQ